MINNVERGNIYVYCLASIVTGGCELLHQLVSFLNDNNRNAYIVYLGNKEKIIPNEYIDYNIKIADQIIDDEDNIIVIDEGFMYLASNIKKANCIFWWLSVDNFFNDPWQLPYHSFFDLYKWNKKKAIVSLKVRTKHFIKYSRLYKTFSIKQLIDKHAVNAYQSEYAKTFLKEKGFTDLIPLKDYINTEFIIVKRQEKENIILYNPKKGIEYTKKLMEIESSLKWIPLINMTRKQLLKIMCRAKVYIDFGNHPGKDRIPREAALNNCVVITGKKGAACNNIDICIPNRYKFDEKNISPYFVIDRIHEIFDNYDECLLEQKDYRDHILSEKLEFEQQIRDLFRL